MHILYYILAANIVISLISLASISLIWFKFNLLRRNVIHIVAFAAGTMLSTSLLHLIPEAAMILDITTISMLILGAYTFFMLLEKILGWHHHHEVDNDMHTIGLMNLLADALHNFLDGMIIAAAFLTNIPLGIVTTVAVLLHEIPQEVGDFGVLIHSGYSVNKAILANLGVSLAALLGGIVGFVWLNSAQNVVPYITSIAAGGFIYISTSDLLPEIKSNKNFTHSWISYAVFILGILIVSQV